MSLADTLEPIILSDGTKINPSNGKVIKEDTARGGFVEIPSNTKAQAIVAKTRRSIAELPMPSQQMNTMSLVLFYSMYGLNDQDISIVLGGLSIEQVKNIKNIPEYQKLSETILNNVLEYESNDILTFFKQNASNAAKKLVTLTNEDGALGLKASTEILDRAGFRPADIVEHRHTMQDSLKIEFIKRDDSREDIPSIETSYKDVTPNGNG
jgi:hypothetical protein